MGHFTDLSVQDRIDNGIRLLEALGAQGKLREDWREVLYAAATHASDLNMESGYSCVLAIAGGDNDYVATADRLGLTHGDCETNGFITFESSPGSRTGYSMEYAATMLLSRPWREAIRLRLAPVTAST